MARSVGVHEAKTNLSRLLARVDAGEEVTITRRGEPVAKLVPVHGGKPRRFGVDRRRFRAPADFDAPLPDAEIASFEG